MEKKLETTFYDIVYFGAIWITACVEVHAVH